MATLRRNRRPPKDPSAALRPRGALERAAAAQFRRKVGAANQDSICNSTSDQVGRIPLRRILVRDVFCVPIFQRRYCWDETQWQTLLEDAWRCSGTQNSNPSQHSLGRLTCTNNQTGANVVHSSSNSNKMTIATKRPTTNLLAGVVEGRSCILDGQQRFTTVTLLLAAIRDLLEEHQATTLTEAKAATSEENTHGASANVRKMIHSIHEILFADAVQMKAWKYKPDSKLEEGVELTFARLVPTFCDRLSYYTAILPESSTPPTTGAAEILPLQPRQSSSTHYSWHRPLAAKEYFLEKLRHDGVSSSPTQLSSLLTNVLDGLTMLFFPVDIHKGYEDGTEDLMVIYERLALRDSTFCRPTRPHEYRSMDGSDMIRNLLLGSFRHQTDALDFYKTYWLPMERMTSEEFQGKTMKELLEAFLEMHSNGSVAAQTADSDVGTNIGGQMYAEFQAWFGTKLTDIKQDGGDADSRAEELVREVGQELLDFARSPEG